MKTWTIVRGMIILVAIAGVVSSDAPRLSAVQIGDTIDDVTFKDIRYLPRSLADFGEQQAYVLFFSNTTCPLVQRYLPVMKQLDETYRDQGVQVVAVNVGPDDSIMEMASHALEYGAEFPFVKDVDGSVAEAVGVERTPGVALLNADKQLVYRGRVDSQYRLGGVRPTAGRADLEEAIKETLAGKEVSVPETPVDGCKITSPALPKPTETITYTQHIARIMKQHCQECHREGTAAPFALGNYEEVSGQGEMIVEVVTEGRMPPWYASHDHLEFKNDRSLSHQQKAQVAQWVAAGMPEGDPADLPEPYQSQDTAWEIGEPDLVIKTSKAYNIPAHGYVPYDYAILPYVFLQDTWVEAFEIKPHNPDVVHHCNMAYGTLGGKAGGYDTFITGYVPGGQAMDLARIEPGIAYKIPARSVLGLQIHHVTTGKEEASEISVGLRYAKSTVRKQSHFRVLDVKMKIPPHHPAWPVTDSKTIPQDATILGMFCHMHLRGKDMTFLAHLPGGKTKTLLEIPNYNFDWQLGYELNPGDVKVPADTEIEVVAHYDNSAFNPYNPDPTRTVPYGQQTFDEMMNGFIFFTYDEENLNIEVDPKTGRPLKKESQQANDKDVAAK